MKNKLIKKTLKIFFIIFFFGGFIALFTSAAITKITSNYSNYFGYSMVTVQSESMAASGIHKGDKYLIYSKDKYNTGDIIVFQYQNELWFHEIVECKENNTYQTKGSSNLLIDPFTITKDQIKGKSTGVCLNGFFPEFPIILIISAYAFYLAYCIWSIIDLIKQKNLFEDKLLKQVQNNSVLVNCILVILIVVLMSASMYPVRSAQVMTYYTESSVNYEMVIESQYLTYTGNAVTKYNNNSGEKQIIVPEYHGENAITSIDSNVFTNNNSVEVIDLPSTITSIAQFNFLLCRNLNTLIIRAENPPSWTSWFGLQLGTNVKIYVPDSSLEKYKSARGWSQFKNQIYPLSTYN